MSFQREKTQDVIAQVLPLLVSHYKELGHDKCFELDPNFDDYYKLEDAGALRFFTSRDERGDLIGYAIYFLRYNLHFRSSLQAMQDAIYIKQENRGDGWKFISWCDDQLRAEKVQAVYHSVSVDHDFGPILERLGYKLVEYNYFRRLN